MTADPQGLVSKMYKGPESLYWLIPIALGLVFEVAFCIPFVSPDTLNHHRLLLAFIVPFFFIAPLGGWWAIYQCVRYEKQSGRYIAVVVLVPLGFVWYYFERYRQRDNFG
jgi:hypothetical protein